MTDTQSSHGRFLCADALSCLGVMLLLGLQYIQKTGFMESVITYDSAPFIAMRWFCLSGAMLLAGCVGYVKSSEQFSLHAFKPLFRLTYIYVIATLCTLLLKKFFFELEITPEHIFQTLRQFSATDTAKFLGMYFALLLAAPFLSAAFQKLQSRNARLAFVVVTAAVSTLQPMLIISGDYLLPEWCKMLAPIAGFAGGAYIRAYAVKRNRILWLFLLLLVWGGQTACVTYICTDRGFLYYPQFDSMASLLSLLTAMFTLGLFHSPARGESGRHSFFAGASGGALIALMLGDVMIDFLMPSIQENFPELELLLIVGFLAVPVVFILSCTVGLFLQLPVFLVNMFTGESDYEDEDYENYEDSENSEENNNKTPDSPNFDMPLPQHKSLRVLEPIPEIPKIPESPKNPQNTDPVLEIMQRTQKIHTIREQQKKQRRRDQEEERLEELRRIQEKNKKRYTPRKQPSSLQEILREQGIPCETSSANDPDSINELIAKITGNE